MLSKSTRNQMWAWHVQERMGTAGTPRTATPRGRSFLKVLSEQQHLQKELAAEKAAREAADARALISADEAAAAVGMLTVISIPVLAYLHAYNTYQAMVLLVVLLRPDFSVCTIHPASILYRNRRDHASR